MTTNELILEKLKNHPELFRTFKEELRATKDFIFDEDGERFTVLYCSLNKNVIYKKFTYTISDYNRTWFFADDNIVDTASDKFDVYKLREETEKAVDNRLKAYNESIDKCFNDVIKDLSFRVENAAKEGRYSVSSGINIYIAKYLDEQDIDKLTIKQRDDWSRIVTQKLNEYFGAKGFNTNIVQSNYYTLDWSYREGKNEWEPNTLTDTCKDKKKVTAILPDIEGDDCTGGITAGKDLDFTTINGNSSKDNLISDTKPIDDTIGDVNPLVKGLYSDIKCPYCGSRHFMEKYSISDCVYRPTIYKDGKVLSPVKGEGMTTTFECLDCGKEFVV